MISSATLPSKSNRAHRHHKQMVRQLQGSQESSPPMYRRTHDGNLPRNFTPERPKVIDYAFKKKGNTEQIVNHRHRAAHLSDDAPHTSKNLTCCICARFSAPRFMRADLDPFYIPRPANAGQGTRKYSFCSKL